jgi:SP family general alpha glucoside:H+ symporter-like MFS transporter
MDPNIIDIPNEKGPTELSEKNQKSLQYAREAITEEDSMSLWEGIKKYPKAAGWSVLVSTAVIMVGFDSGLVTNFFGYPSFEERFGVFSHDEWTLTASWQSGLQNGATVGEILGLFLNGWASEKFGYRTVMMVSLASTIPFIFIAFFANSLAQLQAYQVLMGVPWGVFQTLTTSYAAEVCPVVLRPYLTTWVNMTWHLGGLLSSGILRALLKRTDEWGFRIPFAIQWIWPIPLILGCYLAPESPWWLVRKGRIEDAKKSVRRLISHHKDVDYEVTRTVALIEHTHELELKITTGSSIWDCFKGIDLRRTEIVCLTYAIQNISQSPLNGAFFFEQAGLSSVFGFDLTMGQLSAEILGTIGAWVVMPYFGRRSLYMNGLVCIILISIVMGSLGTQDSVGANWAAGSMVLVNYFVYSVTIGSLVYSLVPELSSSRLRTKSIILARNLYNVVGIINGILVPRMVSKAAWNWGAKAAFFYGGIQVLALVWVYFRLPEPKGRTYAELDALFAQKIPARKFATTEVDPFADDI